MGSTCRRATEGVRRCRCQDRRLRPLALALALAMILVMLPGAGGRLGGVARADLLDDAWTRGNEAYLRGDYSAAVNAYEQLERQGVVSSELTYNLGNAYYRLGQVGRAIWAWERAVALDPESDDARYNLGQARQVVERRVHDKIEGADREPLWIRGVLELTLSTEIWLFLALYFSFFLCCFLAWRTRARTRARARAQEGPAEHQDAPAWGIMAATFGVLAALAGALLVGRFMLARVPYAVVLGDQVAVKEGADPNYRTTFDVHAGLRVRVLDRDQDWVRIRLANGLEGWVPDGQVGRL